MGTSGRKENKSQKGHRPKAATVFAAAFIAGAVAAFGVNRALDVHLAQSKPQVESEPIFVALRSLPQGSPVTVWDVALRDWPKAMMPTAALRPNDSFDGQILKHPLREGQPLLTVQLVKAPATTDDQIVGFPAPSVAPAQPPTAAIPQPDLWAPGEQAAAPVAESQVVPPVAAAESAPAAATAVETQFTGEPTIAVEQTAEVKPELAEPEIVSVVQPAQDAQETLPQPQGISTTPSTPVVRYLVVPERIAVQADRFSMPVKRSPTLPAPESVAAQQQVVQQPPPVREAPQMQANASRQRQALNQPAKPVQRQGNALQPKSQRSAPAKARTASPAPRENASAFESMFPNLAAGMTAVEDQLGKLKRPRQSEPDATAQPEPREPQPQQSAIRPSTRG